MARHGFRSVWCADFSNSRSQAHPFAANDNYNRRVKPDLYVDHAPLLSIKWEAANQTMTVSSGHNEASGGCVVG